MIHEVELFFLGAVTGLGLSMLYDVFRALRKCKRHKEWEVAIEDVLFWMIVSTVLFFLIRIFNKGVLRFYIFLGCGCGAATYFQTITKLIFPVFFCVFKMLKGILSQCCLIFEIIKKIFKNLIILPLKKMKERIKIIRNTI